MNQYNNITHILKTIFVVDFGFPEDMAISLYKESLSTSGKEDEVKQELTNLFADESIVWKELLLNDDYEVLDLDTEEEAKAFIKKVLWDPIM